MQRKASTPESFFFARTPTFSRDGATHELTLPEGCAGTVEYLSTIMTALSSVTGPSTGWPGDRESRLHPWGKHGYLAKLERLALIVNLWNVRQGSDRV